MSYHRRTSEAPMDFEFTSRPSTGMKPAWAAPDEGFSTPRKRPLNDANTPASPFAPNPPRFGTNQDVPFIFNPPSTASPLRPAWTSPAVLGSSHTDGPVPPPPQARHNSTGWAPPPNFSPTKAFPEIIDVDMSEASPPKQEAARTSSNPDDGEEGGRPVSTNALKRVFKARQKRRAPLTVSRRAVDDGLEDETDEEDGQPHAVTQNTSHHYTLNMPSAPANTSELPFLLLGYLQFFFNLSLILVFLYLVIQFIMTVQRDVEQRISEYSLDIVQEISTCTTHYKTNLCASSPIPAMVHQCAVWESCMNRDPTKIGRAKVSAELIAEVVNGFVDPISWKTLAFTLTSLTFLTLFINTLLSLFRSRLNPAPTGPPPAHAGHTAVTPFPSAPPFIAPYAHAYMTPPPGWGPAWRPEEDSATPARRRRLEDGVAKVR